MPQLVKKRRSGWAVLAAGALIASLLAVGANPAGAARVDQDVDLPADTGACVGDAIADNMFTDVSDEHAFGDAINCVAYYGITNGNGDGSTYAPNSDVTRAQMAVFIARAAEVAGVSLGSGSGGYSDIGDIWQEAQDAINGLASKGMIPSGGEFRPGDAVTRAEMATFMVGLLVEGAPNVAIDQDGDIQIGIGGSAAEPADWFADARATVPRDNDEEISALYELGVTKGASAVPGGQSPPDVLVTTYLHAILFVDIDQNPDTPAVRIRNPQGASLVSPILLTLDDDGKATFSTAGLVDIAPVVESDKYEVDIRVQHFSSPVGRVGDNPALPYNYEPDGTVNRGQMAAFITRALAHTQARPAGITAQFEGGDVVVSVRDENFAPMSNVVVDLFRIDTPGLDLAFRGDGSCGEVSQMDPTATTGYVCEIDGTDNSTGGDGDVRVPLGEGDDGGTTVWIWTGDDEDTVDEDTERFELTISEKEAKKGPAQISVTTEHGGEKAHLGSSVLYTVQVENEDGDAASGDKSSGYSSTFDFVDGDGDDLPEFGTATRQFVVGDIDTEESGDPMIFSTEAGVIDVTDVFVKVEPAAEFAVVDDRGANNRATVTVTDQYGDPISGIRVQLTSVDDDTDNDDTVIASNRFFTVNRDGSFSFGYERDGEASSTETLTAVIEDFNHDGDDETPVLEASAIDAPEDERGGIGTAAVEWAVVADADQTDVQQIRAFDTEEDTIFVGGDSEVIQVGYDSNDRFNIDYPDPDGVGDEDDPDDAAATYAAFERELSKDMGYTLTWEINGRGSRATNVWNLIIPADPDN